MWFEGLFQDLYAAANTEKAKQMKSYMRDQFDFLGIPTPQRKAICLTHFKPQKQNAIDFRFTDACYADPYRELQYAAIHYLSFMQDKLTEQHIPILKSYILQKSWWDTIDGLDRIVGNIALRNPGVNETLLAWSLDENFWLRRVAIDHQLTRKEKTDCALLETILINNLQQKEFFINKAIGWSLREYSKTNPDWVRAFIAKHRDGLSTLSIREGSKYI